MLPYKCKKRGNIYIYIWTKPKYVSRCIIHFSLRLQSAKENYLEQVACVLPFSGYLCLCSVYDKDDSHIIIDRKVMGKLGCMDE